MMQMVTSTVCGSRCLYHGMRYRAETKVVALRFQLVMTYEVRNQMHSLVCGVSHVSSAWCSHH